MFFNVNKISMGVIIALLVSIVNFSAYSSESNQGWSDWFAHKVEQYKKAAQEWSPQCAVFGKSFKAEFDQQHSPLRAFDTKFGGRQMATAALAFDLVKSLGCLVATPAGAAIGITKEAVSDLTSKIAQILELYNRGELSQTQARMAIERTLSSAHTTQNLA